MSPLANKIGDTGELAAVGPLGMPPVSKYDRLIARAKQVAPARTIIAHPCDDTSLQGDCEAAEAGLIKPVLVGPAAKISAVAHLARINISLFEIVVAEDSEEAAAKAVELV